ncbi:MULTISPECIES: hypothetical protein [unclassified Mycobacterium]|uniref:hypothetical protein n=1 Tax=unclassified Mycobacterium TaxID=2642494 RepID=UPI0029C8E24A|nr:MULTISPECIES: hypothetical protein [unclassified Mycobacterium]
MAKTNAAVAAVPDPDVDDSSDLTPDAEAVEDPNAAVLTLEWLGKTFTMPKRRGRWPTDAAEAFEDDKNLKALRVLIGEEAWTQLKALCPFVDDLNEFADYAGAKIQNECVP